MHERLTYWKCPKCHGTGRVIYGPNAEKCFECDGTGNAMIDGVEQAHRRRLAEIDAREDPA